MYAIVEIAGQQFKVEKGQELFVHRLEGDEGSEVRFSNVLLIDNNGKIQVGKPTIDGAVVTAKVQSHLKGDKVLVFKKKKRKGYQKLNGHRDYLTKIQIDSILLSAGKAAKAEEKEEERKVEEPVKPPVSKKKAFPKAEKSAPVKPKKEAKTEETVKVKKPRTKAAAKKAPKKADDSAVVEKE
ncbi:MAG: 50S ribosomal protein L21 [Bacteroidetes bacterium]|nr:50S ribosomal protein L21 [Bacteroidota bacterium]